MIERYSDHATNERTFLAWVRTGIAVMAFGFLVEKFDLFLEIAAGSNGRWRPSVLSQAVGNVSGLPLILLGGLMIALATIRFRKVGLDTMRRIFVQEPAAGWTLCSWRCLPC